MMCPKNKEYIIYLKNASFECGQHNNMKLLYDGLFDGVEKGAKNEREAFVEWMKEATKSNHSIDDEIKMKIKELEGKT